METKKKAGFTGSIGFILAAAGSAVGVGNIWRFPYLAAKGGGGVFLLVYLLLVVTFGFTLLSTDIAIGRRTGKNPLGAFSSVRPGWGIVGVLSFVVPAIIFPYYCVIGGWITKYMIVYLSGGAAAAAQEGYFSAFTQSHVAPIVFMLIYMSVTAFVVYSGVEKGIEKFSRVVMPGLVVLIIGIGLFSLTLRHTDAQGVTRTGLEGFAVYVVPDFKGMTLSRFVGIAFDAMGQMFYSLSVAMGIMITYGSYVSKDVNLSQSVSRIEIFDTLVAFLCGLMTIPTVYVFFGMEGMASGPSLMFVSLPKVFEAMGSVGAVVGIVFFVMVIFAALTSSVSIMETLVANCMEHFGAGRKKVSLIVGALSAAAAVVVCLGYNVFYFEMPLPGGGTGQILDLMDYISNSLLMPVVFLLTSIFVGWVVKPSWIIEEMEASGDCFSRKRLYAVMIRYVVPVIMLALLVKALGLV